MIYQYIVFVIVVLFMAGLSVKNTKLAVQLAPLFFLTYFFKLNFWGLPLNLLEGVVLGIFFGWTINRLAERDKPPLISSQQGQTLWEPLGSDPVALAPLIKGVGGIFLLKSVWLPVILMVVATLISLSVVPKQLVFSDRSFETFKIALGILKGWILLPIVYFGLTRAVFKTERDYQTALTLYVFTAVLLTLYSVAIAVSGWGGLEIYYNRLRGPFASPNYLAFYLGPALVFVGLKVLNGLWKEGGSNPPNPPYQGGRLAVHLLFVFILTIGFFWTRSYAAWLAVFSVMFVGSLVKFPRQRGKLISLGLILLLCAFFSQLYTRKWAQFLDLERQSSSSTRLEVWTVAVNLIQQSPLRGIGLGQFEARYHEQATVILGHRPYEKEMLHPHNLYLTFWLYAGFLGLVALIWLIILVFKKINWHSEQSWICGMMLLSVLLHGLFDTPFWKSDCSLLFWLIVAGCLSASSVKNTSMV